MKIKSSKGFSLIELVIVIGILFILGEIAVLQFIKYKGNANLKEAVRAISGDIQLCRQMAVSENTHYRIMINVANNEYTIQKETSPSTWVDVFPVKSVSKDYSDIKIIGAPTFRTDKIIFQPRGTINAGTLEIQHTKLLSKASIITSLMGRVRIQYELR